MTQRISKKFIVFSIVFHAAIIGFITWGALSFHEVKFGGSGSGVVSVWVSDESGNMLSNGKTKKEAFSQHKGKTEKAAEEKPAGKTAKTSGGEGIGGGIGAGVGSGIGGDPALAAIWKKINAAKYYPQVARQRGAEGMPRVRFKVNENGSVSGAELAASCGDKVLDDAAIETVRRAAPLPFYPAPITVTVQYTLK